MPIRITTYHDEDSFLVVNPWFSLALENRFNRMLDSSSFRSAVRGEVNDQFPSLFRQHMNSSSELASLRTQLDTHTSTGIARINEATEQKVRALVNNDQSFSEIRGHIYSETTERVSQLQREADQRYNQRLERLEAQTSNVQSGQLLTFFGGAFVGAVALFLGRR